MPPLLPSALSLAIAGLIGLAVGIEREWSGHATGAHARFAGVRTFLLLGLAGGAAGELARTGHAVIGAVLVAGAAALAVAAYAAAAGGGWHAPSPMQATIARARVVRARWARLGVTTPAVGRRGVAALAADKPRDVRETGAASTEPPSAGDGREAEGNDRAHVEHRIDGTTEAAALVVLALATLAGLGEHALAAGATAVVLLALGEKSRLHAFVRRIDDAELRAAVHFAVLALVVLPLLPEGPIGPLGGVRPRALWIVVLLFSGLSFAGYVARRAVGPGRGYPLTGMLGGLVSSTAVTLHFARQSRTEPALSRALALGTIGACTVLLPRVAIVAALLNRDVALALVPYLVPPLVVGVAIVGVATVRHHEHQASASPAPELRSPLRLGAALQMAVLLQVVITTMAFVRTHFGTVGILATAAVLGLTDVDALTLSMSRLGDTPAMTALAARAIAVGILANTALKLALAVALGTPSYRKGVVLGLGGMGVAVVGAIVGG